MVGVLCNLECWAENKIQSARNLSVEYGAGLGREEVSTIDNPLY